MDVLAQNRMSVRAAEAEGVDAGVARPAVSIGKRLVASDDLEVQLVSLAKSFDGPSTATGTAVLTFTLENLDSDNAATDLAFSDDLDACDLKSFGHVEYDKPFYPCLSPNGEFSDEGSSDENRNSIPCRMRSSM